MKLKRFFRKIFGMKKKEKFPANIYYELSTQTALIRSKNRNTEIKTIIDVGASNGIWTKAARQVYPDAKAFLIEANEGHSEGLKEFKAQNKNIDFVMAAAGDQDGSIYFDNRDLWGGIASHEHLDVCVEVPVVKIDTCVKKYNLEGPFLLKLDTHGFEVPIFEGASETLKNTALIVVETYNFTLCPGALKFYEMCKYMEEKGFGCIDISEPMHRKKDDAFWQIDLFFIPLSSKEFEYNRYV